MIRSGEPGDSVIPEKNKNNKVNKNNRMFKQLIYLISFLSLGSLCSRLVLQKRRRINVNSITSFMRLELEERREIRRRL